MGHSVCGLSFYAPTGMIKFIYGRITIHLTNHLRMHLLGQGYSMRYLIGKRNFNHWLTKMIKKNNKKKQKKKKTHVNKAVANERKTIGENLLSLKKNRFYNYLIWLL